MAKKNNKNILNHKDQMMNHSRHKDRFLLQNIHTYGQKNNYEHFEGKIGENEPKNRLLFD